MKVGIIGAGTMGSGIAQAFAQTEGYEVFLCDINEEFAANGKKKIAKGFEKRIAKGKMTQETADAVLDKITTGVKTICTDCDLVVEAALENMQIKKQTFKSARQTASLLPTHPLCPSQRSALAWIVRLSACTSSIPLLL